MSLNFATFLTENLQVVRTNAPQCAQRAQVPTDQLPHPAAGSDLDSAATRFVERSTLLFLCCLLVAAAVTPLVPLVSGKFGQSNSTKDFATARMSGTVLETALIYFEEMASTIPPWDFRYGLHDAYRDDCTDYPRSETSTTTSHEAE